MINPIAFQEIKKHKKILSSMLVTSILNALSVVSQAWFFATLIADLFLKDAKIGDEIDVLIPLAVAIIIRLLTSYGQEAAAISLAHAGKVALRKRLIKHLKVGGLQQPESHGDMIHLMTDGLDQIEAYISRYIPQMLYTILVPLVMGIAIVDTVPWLGLILIVTVPMIPFFMILIGKRAEAMNKEQWERMSLLSGHFLDMLQGLTTLKVFGRAKEQIQVIARMSGEFRDSTLKVLRVAFLSAFVLELISTVSTALISVYMGLDLLAGQVDFLPAFFVLLLAPEFYTPFRQLGSAFHTGMSGKTALEAIGAYLNNKQCLPKGGDLVFAQDIQHIEVKHLSFTYPKGQHPALEDISISLERGKPTMFVGESGAGKSTLAHLLTGFLQAPMGTVFVNGQDLDQISMDWWRDQIIYVSQKPHLFKGSLRDNLTWGQDMPDEDIVAALKAAEAYDFVMAKADGLDCHVGAGGLGLSGGEQQRIALARAFLRKGQILVLDEVTAHLDLATEESVGRALKRLMQDKLVLIIGHRLQTMAWAHKLVVFRDGRMDDQGSYEDLLAKNGYFASLIKAGAGVLEDSIQADNAIPAAQVQKISSVSHPTKSKTKVDWEGVDTPWGLLFKVLRRARIALVLALIFSFLTVFMNLGLLGLSAWLIATAALHPPLVALSLAITGVRFFGIARAVCRYFERLFSHRMAFQGLYGLRVWFYEKLEPISLQVFKSLGAGDLLGRIMADIETLQFFYLRVLIPPTAALILSLLVGLYLGQFSLWLWLVVGFSFIMTVLVIPVSLVRSTHKTSQWISKQQGLAKVDLAETLNGMEDIIAYQQMDSVFNRLEKRFTDIDYKKSNIADATNGSTMIFLVTVQVAVVAAALIAGTSISGLEAGVYVAVIAIVTQAWFEVLQPMTVAVHHGYESALAVRRLGAIDKAPKALTEPAQPAQVPKAYDIVFDDLNFSYEDKKIYAHFNLTIPEGQHLAIVGGSGAGKSTLFNALTRLYDYQGSIKVGGVELKSLLSDEGRSLFGVVTQDTYIFHASLEENIRLANPHARQDQWEKALQFASLQGLISRLPQGLETLVGSGGQGLSGGERQRVALARLYLRQSPILLLDEPLEGLDQVTKGAIQEDLMAFMEGRTSLYITHQLEGIEKMDRILFMEDGHIVEDGTFEQLIEKKGRFYQYCILSMARV